MFCCAHEEHARGPCIDCGRGLCVRCTERWRPAMCDMCARGRARSQISTTIADAFLALVFAAVGFAFAWNLDHPTAPAHHAIRHASFVSYATLMYVFAGIPFGWRWVSGRGGVFVAPIWVWAIGLAIKLILAYFIGLVALPVTLLQSVRRLQNGRHMLAIASTPH
jgi:hypothetical protein